MVNRIAVKIYSVKILPPGIIQIGMCVNVQFKWQRPSCVQGYHAYNDIWNPVVGEALN